MGRITEVGQKPQNTAISQTISQDDVALGNWLADLANGSARQQITRTVYDIAYSGFSGGNAPVAQINLRNRVSYTVLYNQAADTSYLNRNPASASYYTYDIHGNVDTLLQDYNGIASMKNSNNRFKLIAYNYDLISGKVNEVDYQPGRSDAFYEMYSYDAENRITTVSYSRDNVYQEREAAYEYYKHGPLARTVLGKLDVQGLKYRYTLQGWLKGVNAAIAGVDATAADSSEVFPVSHDAYGFSLHYYPGDYTAIKSSTPYTGLLPALGSSGAPLFNGNIAAMAVNIKAIGSNAAPLVYNYHYDQLNRLVSMDAYSGLNTTTGSFTPIQLSTYAERAGYDPNGNITSYIRHGDAARVQMDSLTYSYKAGKNQLDNVVDNAADAAPGQYSNYNDLKSGQQPGNYQYDAIGNLTKDVQAGDSAILWTVYGKIDSIYKADGTGIKYHYDVAGNRISKVVTKGGTVNGTYYVRDAQGNVLSVYQDGSSMALTQMENHLYGSSRLGMVTALTVANTNVTLSGGNTGIVSTFTRGEKLFELSNHLGNVLVTLTDKKLQHSSDNATVDYYTADVASASDYYPFGMQMPSRNITASTAYRYGFNGKELDPNMDGNNYDYGFRIYNPQIGKFLSVDPLTKSYPWYTPYQFAGNKPIWAIDVDGLEEAISTAPVKYRVNFSATEHEYFNKPYNQTIYKSMLVNPTDAQIKKAITFWRADSDVDFDGTGAMPNKGNTDQKVTSFGFKYGKELNAKTVPYGVIPDGVHRKALTEAGVSVGDLYLQIRLDSKNNIIGVHSGIIGDVGNEGQPGEQSKNANSKTNNGTGLDASNYLYIAFAGTDSYWKNIVGTDVNGKI